MSRSLTRLSRYSFWSGVLNGTGTLPTSTPAPRFLLKGCCYSQSKSVVSEAGLASARKWLEEFSSSTLPRDIGELSFSRSSGPGGQNVNK
jgi:hypothetical protein